MLEKLIILSVLILGTFADDVVPVSPPEDNTTPTPEPVSVPVPDPEPVAGGWTNIAKYDIDLVGLSVRGINYINNDLGLKPGYRFFGISGQPQLQVVYGLNYKAIVVMRLAGQPLVYCDFFMYRQPLLEPQYLDTTSYKISCQNGQKFDFSVTIRGIPLSNE